MTYKPVELIETKDWQGVCLTVEGTDMEDGQWVMAEQPVAVKR